MKERPGGSAIFVRLSAKNGGEGKELTPHDKAAPKRKRKSLYRGLSTEICIDP